MNRANKSTNFKNKFQEAFRDSGIDLDDFFGSKFFEEYSEYLPSEDATTLVNDTRTNAGIFEDVAGHLSAGIELLNSQEYKDFMKMTSKPKSKKDGGK